MRGLGGGLGGLGMSRGSWRFDLKATLYGGSGAWRADHHEHHSFLGLWDIDHSDAATGHPAASMQCSSL